jgi:gas vesicle protein
VESKRPRQEARVRESAVLKERITTMKMNNIVKSILKTAVYLMDQTADTVDRASSRASEMAEDARDAIYPREDHTLRNFLAFAAGVGVGIGAGMLLAPYSGEELRNNITDKVQEITNRVSSRADEYSTGTEGGI